MGFKVGDKVYVVKKVSKKVSNNIKRGEGRMNDKIIVEYSKENLKMLCKTHGCPSYDRCKKGVRKLVKCHNGFGVRFRIWGPK